MKSLTIILAALAVLFAVSCATVPTAGECPDSADKKCLGERICDLDKSRGCVYCTCKRTNLWDSQQPLQQDGRLPQQGAQ